MEFPSVGTVINVPLLKSPASWGVVWTVATLWLLAFHVLMQAWGAMTSKGQAAFAAPGMTAVPNAAASDFSVIGSLAAGPSAPGSVLDRFSGGAPQIWTDGSENRYAEDGWSANY